MARETFKYNPESLKFDRVKVTFKKRFLRFITYTLASVIVAVMYFILYDIFFDTPEEKNLKRENNQLLVQYDLLNKKFDNVEQVLIDIEQRDNNIYRTIFAAEPISKSIRTAGFGGTNRYEELENLSNSKIVIETAKRMDQITKRIYIQSKSFDEVTSLAANKEDLLISVPAIQPISNADLTRVASGFGMRIHPFYKVPKMHNGIDFTAPRGTEIYATGKGTVVDARYSNGGYGRMVVIDHGFGYQTLYAHMYEIKVRKGAKVARGQVIGLVGSTGMSVAPHLHYEVHKGNTPIDPINYFFNDLSPIQYQKIIQLAATSGQSFD